MSKTRTITIDGKAFTLTSAGRVRIAGENLNSYEVRPQDGGDGFTAYVPPGRDAAKHVAWVAAGQPGEFRDYEGYGGRR